MPELETLLLLLQTPLLAAAVIRAVWHGLLAPQVPLAGLEE